MRLDCVMLCGGDREDVAPDAIDSVSGIVDGYVLIDTGPSAQKCIAVLKRLIPERIRHIVEYRREGLFDCKDARNFGLDAATKLGADWCMMLDTDERFQQRGVDVRRFLNDTPCAIVLVQAADMSHTKERFFRLPAAGRYEGRVHETYVSLTSLREVMPIVRFSEVPKPVEETRRVQSNVIAECTAWITDEPRSARAHQYRANALGYFERHAEAAEDYRASVDLSEHPEDKAWGRFMAGSSLYRVGDYESAINECRDGIWDRPDFPELPWLVALCNAKIGHWTDTLSWSNVAIALGKTWSAANVSAPRVTFQYPPAHWNAPWETRALALAHLGNVSEAHASRAMAVKAKELLEREIEGRP